MANDILALLGTIPYPERSSGGPVTQEIRAAIQAKAVKQLQNSQRFQREATAKNKAYSLPPEMQQIMQQQDMQAGMQQPQQPQSPTQAPAPGPSQATNQADVGSLFHP